MRPPAPSERLPVDPDRMMLCKEKSYYEFLGIKPNAAPSEIRQAHKEMYQLYHDDSLASYSFFTSEERRKILAELDDAYATLINEDTRISYDRSLVDSGILEEGGQKRNTARTAVPIFDIDRSGSAGAPLLRKLEGMKEKASANTVIGELITRNNLTGEDLETIRREMGLTLEVIAGITKIRLEYLHAIEEDRHNDLPSRQLLKGFLKSYIDCLGIDTDTAVNLYLKRIPGALSG